MDFSGSGSVAGGSAWTPRNLGNLLAWYRADVGVLRDGSSGVTQWSDVSGNGYHLTQTSAGNRPTYQATGWDGKRPTVSFNGVAQYLESLAPGFADYPNGINTSVSFLATLNTTVGASDRFVLEWMLDPAAQFFGFYITATDGFFAADKGNATNSTGTVSVSGARRIVCLTGGGTLTNFIGTTLDMNEVAWTSTVTGLNKFQMGPNANGSALYSGSISEVAIIAGKPSRTEALRYLPYSAAMWGG